MHKTNCMQSIENISIWEVFSSICPKRMTLPCVDPANSVVEVLNFFHILHEGPYGPPLRSNWFSTGSIS